MLLQTRHWIISTVYLEKMHQWGNKRKSTTQKAIRYLDDPAPSKNAWSVTQITHRIIPLSVQSDESYLHLGYKRDAETVYSTQQQAGNTVQQRRQLMTEWNSIINIKEVNKALEDLLGLLMHCKSAKGPFEVYYRCKHNIKYKYNIV